MTQTIPGWDVIAVMAGNLGASFVASELNIRITFPQTGDYRDFADTEQERRDAIRWMNAEVKLQESLEARRTRKPPVFPKFS